MYYDGLYSHDKAYTVKHKITPFIQQVDAVVTRGGLDGVDFDDEFSKYGLIKFSYANSILPVQKIYRQSFPTLVTELRKLLGRSKIISYFFIGESADLLANFSNNNGVINNVSYIYNSSYGIYQWPKSTNYGTFKGNSMSKKRISAAAVQINGTEATSKTTAISRAKSTVNDGYGLYMMFNLTNADWKDYISAVSQELYGTTVTRSKSYSKDY